LRPYPSLRDPPLPGQLPSFFLVDSPPRAAPRASWPARLPPAVARAVCIVRMRGVLNGAAVSILIEGQSAAELTCAESWTAQGGTPESSTEFRAT